jgi:DNA-binding transcriptional regulator YdaS (Cro superfamily)
MTTLTPNEIIDGLGGTGKVAALLNIKPPSVSEWRKKDSIPEASMHKLAPHIEREMGISRHSLCPDVFGEAPVKSRKVKVA